MTQELDAGQSIEAVIRQRIRGLRVARGWSLDALAARCFLSPSTLSRIETGRRRIALDQLVPIARALGTTLDQLTSPTSDEDVVIRPEPDCAPGRTTWILTRDSARASIVAAKMRFDPAPVGELGVHPGTEWFTVLSGTVRLHLGDRVIDVGEGEAAEFDTMTPHAIEAHGGPVEILSLFDRDGQHAHLHTYRDGGR
ncbi:XRE family transcriptional regulator [Rhodococcus rhodnii]|uniref:Transcriptional regulator n=2 Tax=Rhodococcus rhodnii TaxID=38312 RepID=R7WPI1_9NOCA|nr:helix-turn-helix transcriptional regulator [Rhodococcus rhodnii]EOM75889.1 transcriptional regulator [Rhodococcus rhodnii LMG 5362]TXG91055.1 XRE family transcriptional regulator [Rhodococcus rhodnii]